MRNGEEGLCLVYVRIWLSRCVLPGAVMLVCIDCSLHLLESFFLGLLVCSVVDLLGLGLGLIWWGFA